MQRQRIACATVYGQVGFFLVFGHLHRNHEWRSMRKESDVVRSLHALPALCIRLIWRGKYSGYRCIYSQCSVFGVPAHFACMYFILFALSHFVFIARKYVCCSALCAQQIQIRCMVCRRCVDDRHGTPDRTTISLFCHRFIYC